MRSIAIIPARYASTRFPGKPLADLGGKPVVEWVYSAVSAISALDEVCVATDDERIASAVKAFGGNCVMTRTDHKSGTERCSEVMEKMNAQGKEFDIVVNVQGDEPFVNKDQILTLLSAFDDDRIEIATLAKRITSTEELTSPNNVKVITDEYNLALYFSRTPIPYVRDCSVEQWVDRHCHLKHIGIYAYLASTLKDLVKLSETPLEQNEKLEQLRWLEHGCKIKVLETECENIGIDTPEDLEAARMRLKA